MIEDDGKFFVQDTDAGSDQAMRGPLGILHKHNCCLVQSHSDALQFHQQPSVQR